ncbi:MAG: dihydropteroate synthase, partial [Planctomycetota bacterium]
MGVLNVTPDSFSDGGLHATVEAAVAHAARLLADGADILDVGGESTRPGADRVDAETEIARVVPVVRAVAAADPKAVLSVDTSKAAVAGAAIEAGAAIVNDVTGLTGDPDMPAVCRDADVGVCVMHMRGTPRTMQDDPRYDDVVGEVKGYLAGRRDALEAAGIA